MTVFRGELWQHVIQQLRGEGDIWAHTCARLFNFPLMLHEYDREQKLPELMNGYLMEDVGGQGHGSHLFPLFQGTCIDIQQWKTFQWRMQAWAQ